MMREKYPIICLVLFMILLLKLESFSQQIPIPEFYGFYVIDNGKLLEFKAPQEIGLQLSRGVGVELDYSGLDVKNSLMYFIIYERDLSSTDIAEIYKMKIVKRHLRWGFSDGPKVPPEVNELNKWVVTDIIYKLKRKPIGKDEDMILLVPEKSLDPGVYAIRMGNLFLNFSVNFNKYDKNNEALDRITAPGWEGWSGDQYVPYGSYAPLSGAKSKSSSEESKSVDNTKTAKPIAKEAKSDIAKIPDIEANEENLKEYLKEALENVSERNYVSPSPKIRGQVKKTLECLDKAVQALRSALDIANEISDSTTRQLIEGWKLATSEAKEMFERSWMEGGPFNRDKMKSYDEQKRIAKELKKYLAKYE